MNYLICIFAPKLEISKLKFKRILKHAQLCHKWESWDWNPDPLSIKVVDYSHHRNNLDLIHWKRWKWVKKTDRWASTEKLPNSTKAAWLVLRITGQWQKLQVNAFAHMELLCQSLPPLSESLKAIGIMDPCFLTPTASGLMEVSLMVLYKV